MNIQSPNSKAPPIPKTLEQTGLNLVFIRDILLKTLFRRNLTLVSEMAQALCVPTPVVQEMVEITREQGLIETIGNTRGGASSELRFQLTENGKSRAIDALAQSEYYGALPVPLETYREQTKRQSIADVAITKEKLENSVKHLVMPEGMLDQLGPAVNSGKSILLYGPPGNGKSSISNGIRDALGDKIYVPRFLEYSGQVIAVYDPIVHSSVEEVVEDRSSLRLSGNRFDNRYVLCKRPSVMTGGELTLSMLDLNYNKNSKTYQAPLQLKATGGVFIVDDLGRQAEPPQALINRWIVPMESGYDILALQSGEKFMVPFDTLVIFSTNFHPAEMFDGAALRRIYYKVLVDRPSRDEMIQIYMRVARAMKVELDEAVLIHLIKVRYPEVNNEFAAYHAPFLIDQMMAICAYEGRPRKMTVDLLERAWKNLFVAETDIEK